MRVAMRSALTAFVVLLLLFSVAVLQSAEAYYYPPYNIPPGPPPNYSEIDTSYFIGAPALPDPPPDSGGFFIWVDETGAWNIANHLYVRGNNIEHYHGSILAVMSSPPAPGVNVFATNFELISSGSSSGCYRQNDRWGWYQWDENLYEIWWDVATRDSDGDENDFMKIRVLGCAIDFNLWCTGHDHGFGPSDIYLGESMTTLSDIPEYYDAFPGIGDPYESQHEQNRNISIFRELEGTGQSYNKCGLINPGQTYPCGLIYGETYGARFGGAFAYEANGIQFSATCVHDPCEGNSAPELQGPYVYEVFQCAPAQYSFDVNYFDHEDNFHHFELLSGPGTIDSLTGLVCFTPGGKVNGYLFTVMVIDSCGTADTAEYAVGMAFNEAPAALSPMNQTILACNLGQICIPGFTATDPDNNLASKTLIGGTLHGDTACFTPVAGANTLRLIAADSCGMADTSITVVTVNLNQPPVATSPADQSRFVCELSQICIPGFTASDPDGNLTGVVLQGGTLNGETACFTPVVGPNTLRLIATDACGRADTSTTIITINNNNPPVAVSPSNQSMFACNFNQICLPGFTASDIDNNIASRVVLGGTLAGETVCFTPVMGPNALTFIVTDACGRADTSVTVVTIGLNQAPVASAPANQNMFVCNLNQICIPGFMSTDPDNNIVSRVLQGGTLHGDTACFVPVPGPNTLRLVVTDACGLADTAAMVVTITVNQPPVAVAPSNQNMFVCDLSQVCLPGFAASDPDGNLASAVLIGGTLQGNNGCFTPVVGPNTLTLIATDACGAADTAITVVTITLNTAPQATVHADTSYFLCAPTQICLPGFSGNDIDNNISTVTLIGGALHGDTACFTPVAGINTLRLIVADACGAADTSVASITVTLNGAPVASSPADTSLLLPTLAPICLPGFTGADPDGNLISKVVTGGTLSGDTVCFTPVAGINTLTLIATDACGAADTSITRVSVNVTISLALVGGAPPVFTEEVADSFLVAVTGGDPGTLAFATEFTGHSGTPSRLATTYNSPNFKTAVTFDYLGEFSSAQSPFTYRMIASDGHSADTLELSLIVNDNNRIPSIASIDDTTIFVGSTLAFAVTGNDLDTDNTLALTKNSGPGNFVAVPGFPPVAGNFSWTPAVGHIGSHQVIIAVDDGRGGAVADTVNITVEPTGIVLNVAGGAPPEFIEEVPDSFFVVLGGFDPASLSLTTSFPGHGGAPARYSTALVGGSIRVAVTFDFLGEFSNAQSPFAYRIIAADNFSADTLNLSLVVNDNNRLPEIAVGSNYTVIADHPISFTVSANDLDSDNTLGLAKVSGPGAFAGASGPPPVSNIFSWTPTDADVPGSPHTIRFAVSDGRGGVDTANVTITVFPEGTPTIGIIYSPSAFHEGRLDSLVFTATDPEGDALGGFGYRFLAPESTFAGASFAVRNDTAYLRLTFDYLGSWSSAGSQFPLRLLGYSVLADADSAYVNVLITVVNVNRKPELIVTGPHSIVAGEPVTISVVANDPDTDDNIALTASSLPTGSNFSDQGNRNGQFTWLTTLADTGLYSPRFFANDGRSQPNSRDTVLWSLEVTVPDTGTGPNLIGLDMPGRIDMVHHTMTDCRLGYPGAIVEVPVTYHTADFFCGGFELLIRWDPTALTFLGMAPADWLARVNGGSEYHNVTLSPEGPGTARFVWVADINDGDHTEPAIPDLDPNFLNSFMNLRFQVAPGLPFGMTIPVEFYYPDEEDYTDNSVSDSTGYIFSRPPHDNGCVEIFDYTALQGDPNMNCLDYEIADAVLVAQRLIQGMAVWGTDDFDPASPTCTEDPFDRHDAAFNPAQEAAADLNGNGFADVGDLVWFVNVINGIAFPPKLDPVSGSASITIGNGTATVNSGVEIGAAIIKVLGRITPIANGMDMQYGYADGVTTILIYSIVAERIPAGGSTLFTYTGEGTIQEFSAADIYGRLLDATSRPETNLPAETSIGRNYPNPFNPATSFRLALANAGEVELAVYDITGRKVRTLVSSRLEAGYHDITWDGRNGAGDDVASGVYFARLVVAGGMSETVKMSLIR